MLSPIQRKAISLLAAGMPSNRVAEEVDVTPQTISTWKGNPEFVAGINQLVSESIESARTRLRSFANTAVEQLIDLAQNAKAEEARRRASVDILTMLGMSDPSSAAWKHGIGPTTAEGCKREARQRESTEQLIDSLL